MFGVFRGNEHIWTIHNKASAEQTALDLGEEYYARELTPDEYYTRMAEIREKTLAEMSRRAKNLVRVRG